MKRGVYKLGVSFLLLVISSMNLHAQKVKRVPMLPLADDVQLDAAVLEGSIRKGVDFLVKSQNKNGSWGGPTKTKGLNIYAPLPGAHHAFRMGTSCLALTGLLDSGDRRAEVLASIEKAEKWLLISLPRLRRADITTTYNVWGHGYALQSLSALAIREGVSDEQREIYKKAAQSQLDAMVMYQDIDGGWGYYSKIATGRPSGGSMSFTSAAVLVGVYDCQQAFGISLPEKRLKLGVKSIQYQRNPDFSYSYAHGHKMRPRYPINRPGGSLGRSQSGNAALRLFDDPRVTDKVIIEWLDKLVKRNGWLDIGRKRPRPHETHFAVSGYFYYFGHYYAARCIEVLPESEQVEWQAKLARIIIDKQESDGCWWDFPLYDYHQPYGTGFALSTLVRCRK